MNDPLPDLVARARALRPKGRRALIALAGPPASGKSTLAEGLAEALGPMARAVPMDGFHLDDAVLEARGLRARKGAPETFDALGFLHAMDRLATEPELILPVFDRHRELSLAGALVVGPDCKIAVVEGNYLCFAAPPWDRLMALWDLSVFLDLPEPTLRTRLEARWQSFGRPDAAKWIETNDLPNIRRVQCEALAADIVYRPESVSAGQPR